MEIDAYARCKKGVVVQHYEPIHSGKVRIDIFIESHCEDSVAFMAKLRLIHDINCKTFR